MKGLIAAEEIRKLQKRMGLLMEDLGLTRIESRYLEEMERMQKRMSELMEEAVGSEELEEDTARPLADVAETDEEIIVTVDLPGIDKQDVEIAVSIDGLTVLARRKTEIGAEERNYHQRERTCRKLERTISLPAKVKIEGSRAKLESGELQITIPKEAVTSRRRINID